MSHKTRVAFQGEHGAFSEEAAIQLCGWEIQLVPRPTFDALFSSVEEGLADFIVTPIENSLIGSIRPAAELFARSSLRISGEVTIAIAQHLIGCPGSTFADLKIVESHSAALEQCRRFFNAHPDLRAVKTDDTAGSVARIVARGDRTRAAIAGKRAAELYGGLILREHIEDRPENRTRFLLLADSASSNTSAELYNHEV